MIDTSKLEPAAEASDADGRNLALFSIAMSLKRIADQLCGNPQAMSVTEAILETRIPPYSS